MELSQRIKVILKWVFLALIVVAIVMTSISQEWQLLAFAIAAFFLMFLPGYYQRKFDISLPNVYEIVVLVFIFASLYLGEVHDFYNIFPWWDTLLHSFSGIILFIFAMSILLILDDADRVFFRSPIFVVIFGLSVAMGLGGVWEIFEFWMDNTFGLNMQKDGLNDTMWDLVYDLSGASAAAFFAYFEIKNEWRTRVVEYVDRKSEKNRFFRLMRRKKP